MTEYLLDRRDVDFVLFEHLGLDSLLASERYKDYSRELFEMVLGEAQKMAQDVLAPLQAVGDRQGAKLVDGRVVLPEGFKEAYKKYSEAGWTAPHLSPEYGGQGMPAALFLAASEFFVGACTSFIFFPGLTSSGGHLIESFASKDIVERFVPNLYSGKWAATMCLTEPHAGSAVGDIKTFATPNDDGTYNVTGTKIFISCGEHDLTDNICHLVLARVKGDPDGIKGISLFLVPKVWVNDDGSLGERNDVHCAGLEHKMGIHACPTCVMQFGDNGGARGYLIGERRQGIVAMFQMMNEARIVCGMQGVALGNAAFQHALAYARERVQGTSAKNFKDAAAERVKIVEHPDVRRMLATMKAYGEGLRALLYRAAFIHDQHLAETDPAKKQALWDRLDLLTPICKAFATDKGFKMTELAIQTYGGYGYISEYPVEQYMRDTKIASLYEGTNGIQALDLLGRKMRMKGGAVFMSWLQEVNAFVAEHASHDVLAGTVKALEAAKNSLAEVAMGFATGGHDNMDYPLFHASNVLEMMGNIVVGKLLTEQALIAARKLDAGVDPNSDEGIYLRNKVNTAKFFASNILPQTIALAKTITSRDDSGLQIEF